ncbi:MAG: serine racemase VanT catalytic subunit [Defluviitaleaceae bacterium]|nr:serine racemase VanT catalytic subunit [Defluviitaleaceae bacterium]
MMASAFPAGRAWIELNMENLRHNVNVLQHRLPDTCRLMPAIKADAYGHGALHIAKELNTCGINAFCVASVQEGVNLRLHGIKGEVLILGYTHPMHFHMLIKYSLMQTVIDYSYATILNGYNEKIKVHIMIDTGMHRLGERAENTTNIINIFKCENLEICGIYTHLGNSDSNEQPEKEMTQLQIKKFNNVISIIEAQGLTIPTKHIISSYGVFNYPELAYDYARVGIALFGMLSRKDDTKNYDTNLRPVLSIKTRVSAVIKLKAGDIAGYGLSFKVEKDMEIAALAIGYADGVPRSLSCGKGHILINGKKAKIISHICMDQTIIDITNTPSVKQGDIAVIIGNSGEEEITACDIAEKADTIANEVLSRLGSRLEKYIMPQGSCEKYPGYGDSPPPYQTFRI